MNNTVNEAIKIPYINRNNKNRFFLNNFILSFHIH